MDWYTTLDEQVAAYLPDLTYLKEEPMSRHHLLPHRRACRRLALPERGEQLVLLMSFAREAGTTPLVVGNGTNLLVSDRGLDRLVIDTTGMRQMERSEGNILTAEAGVPLAVLRTLPAGGPCGAGIRPRHPRTLGGAVCMNAGAYGGEMKQVVTSVTALFPEEGIRTLTAEELDFSYRHSFFSDHPDAVVLRATVALTEGAPEEIREKMQDFMSRRKASQPLEFPSAGSTFKRPAGHFAGTLIDQCGLKGLTVGGAQVSEKHAGFVINRGGATFEDVTELMRQVQQRVYAETGVRLEPEVRIVEA